MGKYRLTFRKSVAKDLRALPTKDIASILKRIRSLAGEPRPHRCEKLSGQERYRVRQGAYRIIYEINDDGVLYFSSLRGWEFWLTPEPEMLSLPLTSKANISGEKHFESAREDLF